jgi:hypothetical protein
VSAGKDVFKRPRDFDDRALGVSLRPYEWEVLLSLDGRTPLVQLLRHMGLEELDADDVADELGGKGLMDQCVVTYGEFMRERGMPAPGPSPAIVASAGLAPPTVAAPSITPPSAAPQSAVSPSVAQPSDAPPSIAPSQASTALSLDTTPAMIPTPPVPEPPVKPQTNGSTAATSSQVIRATIKPPPPRLAFSLRPGSALPHIAVGITGYKLKPLFDFIIDKAGGDALPKVAAQLAVYRVFRRVPRELVLADNIHSLNIADPTIEVHNKELYDAIIRAIEATFGVKYDSNQANRAIG